MQHTEQATILMYHAVGDYLRYRWSISAKLFEQQMLYLAHCGREVVSLAELVRRLKTGESLGGAIIITFDDGYRDNLTLALPILERYRFPATVFVSPGLLGTPNAEGVERLTREELSRLAASSLITIGSHSTTHPKLAKLPLEAAYEEITTSKQLLEEQLDRMPEFFAYPHGNTNTEVARLVSQAGFNAAVTTRAKNVSAGDDLFLLPRVGIERGTNFSRWRSLIAEGPLSSFLWRVLGRLASAVGYE